MHAACSTSWEDERYKHTMLYVLNSSIVFSFLGCLILLVDGGGVFGAISMAHLHGWTLSHLGMHPVLGSRNHVLWCQGEPHINNRWSVGVHSEAAGEVLCQADSRLSLSSHNWNPPVLFYISSHSGMIVKGELQTLVPGCSVSPGHSDAPKMLWIRLQLVRQLAHKEASVWEICYYALRHQGYTSVSQYLPYMPCFCLSYRLCQIRPLFLLSKTCWEALASACLIYLIICHPVYTN